MTERRGARAARRLGLAAALVAAALGLVACDGSTSRGVSAIRGGRLVVYSSLPLIGPSREDAEATLAGERMALAAAHGHVGRDRIVLRSLDDATRSSHGWDPGQTTADATRVATDQSTIGYLGDLDSGASAVSLPILNRARIPQISPLSTAVGLTRGGAEAAPGEPQKYYPAMVRTFARVVPSDVIQSSVQISLQQSAGCVGVYLLYDADVDGRDAATSFEAAATRAGLRVLGFDQFDPAARNYASLAVKLQKVRPDCVLISALVQDHAMQVTQAVARALPGAQLYATAALAEAAYVDPAAGGVSDGVGARLVITAPTLARSDYPRAGRRLLDRLQRRYATAGRDGIWGYEAMSLMLASIDRASGSGRRPVTRRRVLHALFSTRDRHGVLGSYSIDAAGDTTLRRFGAYRVEGGQMVFWKAVRG